jgi:hypothetical protein
MALVLNDRVLETTAVTGTGPATLLGASSGFQSFLTGIGASNTTYYCIVNPAVASEFEVGLGTLDATGLILTRTTVYKSSNSNNAVVFTAGTKTVFVTYPSSRSVNQDESTNVTVPGTFTAGGAITASTGNIIATAGGVTANAASTFNGTATVTTATNSALTVNNGGTGTPLANSVASFFGNVNSFSQINYQNLNAGTSASTDFVATADNGTDSTNFVNFGINSSTYNLGTFTITGANDGYMFSQSSNLAVGTGAAATSVKFFQGGTLAANEVARFAPTTNNLLVGTTSDGAGTSKMRVNGVIESMSGGIKFPSGQVQTNAATIYGVTIDLGTKPIVSHGYVFADANVTTASHISMLPNAKSTNTLIDIGPITGGSAYTNGTYYNVPLTGGSGTGAVAAQVVVSTGAISSVVMPNAVGSVILGTIVGGSGYLPLSGTNTYYNVPLTGGAGVGAAAVSVTVTDGAVTAVVLPAAGVGAGYATTNVLTASNTFLGGAGSGFTYTLTQVSSLGINYAYGDTLSVAAANVGGTGSGFSTSVGLLSAGGDELEMDGIKVSAVCLTNGLVNVYVDASPGYIAGGRTFAYTLG